jgi:hypothetical protein
MSGVNTLLLANGLPTTRSISGITNYLTQYVPSTSGVPNPGNGNFENGTSNGWSLAHSSLTSLIPTSVASAGNAFSSTSGGSAASGNLSLSVVSSGQLSGLYSGSLVSSAASTAGDLLISSSFYVDKEDQANMLQFSFVYNVQSGASNLNFSGTSSNTFAVYIYDVTNGAWIQPAGVYNFNQTNGTGRCTGTLQTTSNSTEYQIAVVNVNASAGAYTLYVDDFNVGPQIIVQGNPVSDWTSYTPTITGFGTVTGLLAYWKQVGDSVEVNGFFTAGTTTAVGAGISLPSVNINTTKITGDQTQSFGLFWRGIHTTSTVIPGGTVGPWAITTSSSTSTSAVFVSSTTDSTAPLFSISNGNAVGATGDTFSFYFKVPIAGWSSNVSMSNTTDTRVVAFYAAPQVPTGTINSTGTVAKFGTVTNDTHAGYSTSTGLYTVPVSGYYSVSAVLNIDSASASVNQFISAQLQHNAAIFAYNYTVIASTTTVNQMVAVSSIVLCSTGDTLAVLGAANTTTPVYASALGSSTLSISRLSGPSAIAATETVACQYLDTAAPSFPNGPTIYKFATKVFDTHNAMNTSTGLYTVPVSGKYRVRAMAILLGTVTTTQFVSLLADHNGAFALNLDYYAGNGADTDYSVSGDAMFQCSAGDTLYIEISTDTVGNQVASASSGANYVEITRVGN